MLSGNGVVFVPANNAKPKQRSLPPSLSGGAPPKIKKASSYKKPPSSSSSSNSNSSSSFNNQSTIKSYQAPAKTLGSITSSNDKLKSKQQDLPPTIFPELVSFDLNQCDTYQSLLSKLSEEQMNVLKCVMEGHSIFITGVAGTGKSFLLESIIQTLSNVQQKKVVVTASTGISAVNIGGSTIHSFAGIRVLDNGKVDSKTAWRNEKEWRSVDVLIIDEISMIDGQYFDQLESIATEIRCFFEIAASRAPKEVIMKQLPAFGGIQVILCGDFLQLPPVSKSFKNEHGETIYQKKEMCFKANSWERTIKYTFELTNVFRQEEKEWISILNSIRCCQNNNNIVQTLRGLENNKFDGIEKATVIHTLNKNVDSVNDTELLKLSPPQYTYKDQTFFSYGDYDPNVDHPTVKEYIRSAILSNFNSSNASQEINLRVGAQVMIIKNDFTNQLVNGTRGEIIGFVKQTPSDLQSSNKNIKQYAEQYITENGELFPKVVFTREENGKETKIIKIVHPTIFETDGPKKSKGVRIQIPLKLAYAMTVHKTQGLTLQKCVIDLSTVFSPGQIYVALSRAKTMKYLKVTNFNAYHLTKHINREAIDFYNKLKKQDKYLAQDTDSKELFIENLLKKNQESFEKRRKIFEETIKNLDLSDFNANSGSGTKKRKNDSGSSSSSSSGTSYHSQIMKKSKLNPKSTSSSSTTKSSSSGVSKSGKVYCVCIGRRPGIFNTWDECKMQVDQFQGARFKSFTSRLDAEKYMIENGCEDFIK